MSLARLLIGAPPAGTVKFAKINTSSSGATLVAAVTGKRIRVLNYAIVADAAVEVNFESDTTDISGPMSLPANGGVSANGWPAGVFETAAGAALKITLSGAVEVNGHLAYVEV